MSVCERDVSTSSAWHKLTQEVIVCPFLDNRPDLALNILSSATFPAVIQFTCLYECTHSNLTISIETTSYGLDAK